MDKEIVDLDNELWPQKRLRAPDEKIPTDPANLMDNWFISSKETKRQRDSKDPRERRAWEARRDLHPLSKEKVQWWWKYSRKSRQRKWTVSRNEQHKSSRKTSNLTLNEPTSSFPIEFGNFEISWIYRDCWVCGDTREFLNRIYSKFEVKGIVPEQNVWQIFACLVSELVPENQAWQGAPVYIISSPNTIWQIGKCMLHIVTRGRFWDEDYNALNPVERNQKFGQFKQETLQANYTKNLMKYILGCLTIKEYERFTRQQLMVHFQAVQDIYDGTYVPPPVEDPLDGPYTPKDSRIPAKLTQEEGLFYEGLIQVLETRELQSKKDGIDRRPHIVTITDLAKDYDDLMAMICLKELDRLGIIKIEGFVANLMPADRRALFGRGALDSLGRKDIPVARGTVGDAKRQLNNYLHEFDNTERFIADAKTELEDGQDLLARIFTERSRETKITVLTISSLMDIAQFSKDQTNLLRSGLANVVLQGGYRMEGDKLVPDPAAANNRFDLEGAEIFHKFMQDNEIPSTAWTKVAANATPIYSSLFEFLLNTGHPLGLYLHAVQTSQELNFYERCCSDKPFAPHMTQDWAVTTKSTWFAAGHEPDEPYPMGEAMLPFFTKVIGYDALAVVGASGEDVLQHFGIVKPLKKRLDVNHPLHRLIGVPKSDGKGDDDGLPEEENFNGKMLGVAISALMKGSILSFQQGLS
ncbi:uncharacterized protein RAG0_14097 [Rhynchosporium agropyri]|uniref:Inosine/uridine-preferring nucleoside hydrolase domain-containing protein n=1 Tax=Rhynchosporium agropyri TaxID=914238 RepID=A0A1E1LHT7_9HELO|nr:uncharacterized protein RAG0_14097 [Rhynchosporium agropyri]